MSYTLLSETKIPYHDGDEHATTIRMYDVDDETREFLYAVRSYERMDGYYGPHNHAPADVIEACRVEYAILNDLGLSDDLCVRPGALYHRYDATFYGGIVIVADTIAYNV